MLPPAVDVILFSYGSLTAFASGAYIGHNWHDRPWKKQLPKPTPTRWNNPADYRCPVCTHHPKEHYSIDEARYPRKYLFGRVEVIRRGCSVKGCLCGRSQEFLMREAETWSFEPPSVAAFSSELL